MSQKRSNEELIRLATQYHEAYQEAGIEPAPMERTASTDHVAGPADPWSQDAFDPFHGPNRGLRRRAPSQAPDTRLLFFIQKDLLRAISAMEDKDHGEATRQLQNAYKSMNRYLRTYATHPHQQNEQGIGLA